MSKLRGIYRNPTLKQYECLLLLGAGHILVSGIGGPKGRQWKALLRHGWMARQEPRVREGALSAKRSPVNAPAPTRLVELAKGTADETDRRSSNKTDGRVEGREG